MYVVFLVVLNVIGILIDIVVVVELCYKYGVLFFWDYVIGGLYFNIDMNLIYNG